MGWEDYCITFIRFLGFILKEFGDIFDANSEVLIICNGKNKAYGGVGNYWGVRLVKINTF